MYMFSNNNNNMFQCELFQFYTKTIVNILFFIFLRTTTNNTLNCFRLNTDLSLWMPSPQGSVSSPSISVFSPAFTMCKSAIQCGKPNICVCRYY